MAEQSFQDASTRETMESNNSAISLSETRVESGLSMPDHVSSASSAENRSTRDEVIEPGRSLAIADFSAPAINPGERLIRMAYRMGIPGSMLTKPMGKKVRTKLLATVKSPLKGNRMAGTALRAGHFLIHGAKTPVAQIDFGGAGRMTGPLERTVHSFEWLADLDACAAREEAAPVAERILSSWLKANPTPPSRFSKGPAWEIGITGSRLLNWLVHAPLILSGTDKQLRARTLRSIAESARWLDRNVTKTEDGVATVAGWCAIVAAGLLLTDGRPRRLFGEAGLLRALGDMVGDDGGVLSRSPLAQMEAIALLIKLRACYHATRSEPPEAIEGMLHMLVPPLLALTHGDGSLGSWQGAWAITPETLSHLIEASGVRTRPLREVRQWGFQRIAAGKSILQFDAAPPPLPRQARYGCASTLAFELSHAGQRIIVNCGGAGCAGGLVPVRLEQGLRATAAHSTLTLDDANSTAILINGGIGNGVSEVDFEKRILGGENEQNATHLEASHNGYASRHGLTHSRILILRDDGTELRGEDMLLPTGRKGKRGKVNFAIRFHLGPNIEARLSSDNQGAGLILPDGSYWQFRAAGLQISVEDSFWVDGNARPVLIQQLVIQDMVSRGGGNFSWLLKRMS